MHVSVRTATPADQDAVRGLIGQMRVIEGLDPALPPDAVSGYLGGGRYLSVAENNGVVVGMLSLATLRDLFHGGENAFVQELVVDAPHRGRGVGGALLDSAVALAKSLGCPELGLCTGTDNTTAHGLYESRKLKNSGVHFERHVG